MARNTSYIIEIEDEPVGLLVPDRDRAVFHAVHPSVQALHGRVFTDAVEARRAARNIVSRAA